MRVVEHKRSKKLYALKYIDKARCVRQKAVGNIIQERRLLEEVCTKFVGSHHTFCSVHIPQIDHLFIVNLRYAFQDDENCFFVLDLMLGGDLRCMCLSDNPFSWLICVILVVHLDRKGTIQEDTVRFWMAELASALEYLHRQRIIHRYECLPSLNFILQQLLHRDIKPDNILLDSMGHAHITDFNVAIHYSSQRLHTSVAGSMAYMAPQVVGKKGYSWQVDWWSLGITAFELLFHKRPFDGRNAEKMTQSILKDPLNFPEDVSSRCSEAGIEALKGVSSFINVDLMKLMSYTVHRSRSSD